MKKISEKLQILGLLIVGIVISSIIATKAATTLSSTLVYYDTSKSGGSSSNVNGAIDELYSLTTDRDKLKSEILDLTYPVGSIYMSTEYDTVEKVQERFGGTWERYAEGTMLMSVDSNHAVNTTGGSSSVTLKVSQLPTHSSSGTTSSSGSGYSIGYTSSSRGVSSWTGSHVHSAADGGRFVYNHYNQNLGTYSYSFTTVTAGGFNPNASSTAATTITVSGQTTQDYYANKITGVEAHTHTFTGNYTNNSQKSIDVQNPYTAVYMYKRTA